jgi:DNA-binding protein HU-beta
MNQSELITKVAAISGESKKSTECVLKAAADVITSTLQAGGEVTLPGLGKLYVKDRAAREGRNPKTGEKLQIPAGKSPGFKASQPLKDAVSQD